EEVVRQSVYRPAQFLLDTVHDHDRVCWYGTRVISDEKCAARRGDSVQPLPLRPEPSAIHRSIQPSQESTCPIGPSPLVDIAEPRLGHDLGVGPAKWKQGASRVRPLSRPFLLHRPMLLPQPARPLTRRVPVEHAASYE